MHCLIMSWLVAFSPSAEGRCRVRTAQLPLRSGFIRVPPPPALPLLLFHRQCHTSDPVPAPRQDNVPALSPCHCMGLPTGRARGRARKHEGVGHRDRNNLSFRQGAYTCAGAGNNESSPVTCAPVPRVRSRAIRLTIGENRLRAPGRCEKTKETCSRAKL